MSIQDVWVLLIESKWGADVTVWEDYDDAVKTLTNYVCEHWDSYFVEEYGAWDDAKAEDFVNHFFEDSHDDSYQLESAFVNSRGTA